LTKYKGTHLLSNNPGLTIICAGANRHGQTDHDGQDLEYLCERIEESSGILISLSTIKRILNGQYNRLPQVATLNGKAVYPQ
jgi:hypothetical protein